LMLRLSWREPVPAELPGSLPECRGAWVVGQR
jgi:hypothetical protein